MISRAEPKRHILLLFFPVWQILEEIIMKIFILKQISKYFWRTYTFN